MTPMVLSLSSHTLVHSPMSLPLPRLQSQQSLSSSFLFFCVVFCCVLCCAVLCCAVLCCAVLCCFGCCCVFHLPFFPFHACSPSSLPHSHTSQLRRPPGSPCTCCQLPPLPSRTCHPPFVPCLFRPPLSQVLMYVSTYLSSLLSGQSVLAHLLLYTTAQKPLQKPCQPRARILSTFVALLHALHSPLAS